MRLSKKEKPFDFSNGSKNQGKEWVSSPLLSLRSIAKPRASYCAK